MLNSSPINPSILKWARETAGLSIQDVVRKLDRRRITEETVKAWENGEAAPDYMQLERLAYEVYKRPLALFFFPHPPPEETPRQAFRTLPDSEIEQLPQRIRFLLRQAKSLQLNVQELYGGVNPTPLQILRDLPFDIDAPVPELAKTVRQFLGINLEEQFRWRSLVEAFKGWRDALEEHGVLVFKDAFKEDSVSGFCLHDDNFPLIYVNNTKPYAHQIFTLFHELAHLLSGTGGIDTPVEKYIDFLEGRDREIEILCSSFASAFLVPQEDFDSRIPQAPISEEIVVGLAEKYRVSREVILRRLRDKRLVSHQEYGRLVAKWRIAKLARTGQGGDYYRTKGAYLGERYLELVFSTFYQNKITVDQLADYLGVKVSRVPGMEALLYSKGAVA